MFQIIYSLSTYRGYKGSYKSGMAKRLDIGGDFFGKNVPEED